MKAFILILSGSIIGILGANNIILSHMQSVEKKEYRIESLSLLSFTGTIVYISNDSSKKVFIIKTNNNPTNSMTAFRFTFTEKTIWRKQISDKTKLAYVLPTNPENSKVGDLVTVVRDPNKLLELSAQNVTIWNSL